MTHTSARMPSKSDTSEPGRPVGVGLIGVGRWGRRLGQAVARSKGLDLVSCFARSVEARESAASEFECRAAPSIDAMLSDPEVEAILLLTPNHTHEALTRVAASRGRHVFVEKPIAADLEAADGMAAACRESGVILQVGHCFRRLGASRAAADLIRSGALGKVVLAEANFSLPGRFEEESWRSRRETLAGGALTQLGIHHIDTLQAWLGPAKAVTGTLAHVATRAEIDDVGVAVLAHDSGARSVVCSSYVSPKTYRIRLYGTEANLELHTDMSIWPDAQRMDEGTSLTLEAKSWSEPIPFESRDMLADELGEFARCVRTGEPPETGPVEATRALRAVLDVVSGTSGR